MVTQGQLLAGRYRVIQPIAAGGAGGMWLGVDQDDDEPVAIKQCVLPAGLTPDQQDQFRVWTVREARAFAVVGHPNVVRMQDVLPDDEAPWIVTEYVPSLSLRQVLDESGPLPPARVAGIGLAVLEALLAVRRAGLLHLDVKPGNVLIGTDGRVMLTGFGPAVTAEGARALTGAGVILGTPEYLAPERLTDGVVLPESDLWSLGATLYHAVEGRPPFDPGSTPGLLRALALEEPDPPQRAGPLTPLLTGLLRRDPAARLDPLEVQRELRLAVNPDADRDEPVPVRPALAGPSRPKRRRRFAMLAALIGVLVVLIAAFVVMRPGGSAGEARAETSLPSPPDGYDWASPASGGYRIAIPVGWGTRSLDQPGDLEIANVTLSGVWPLQVRVEHMPSTDLVADLQARESRAKLPNYQRIRLEWIVKPSGGIWEYTYDDPAYGPTHGLQRVVEADNGLAYVFDWRVARDDWAQRKPLFDQMFSTFMVTAD